MTLIWTFGIIATVSSLLPVWWWMFSHRGAIQTWTNIKNKMGASRRLSLLPQIVQINNMFESNEQLFRKLLIIIPILNICITCIPLFMNHPTIPLFTNVIGFYVLVATSVLYVKACYSVKAAIRNNIPQELR